MPMRIALSGNEALTYSVAEIGFQPVTNAK
ncbi:hypothetical protein FBZ94_104647 [Bradyrhizobium sacchari]|uniref:Uncharacterized protein n=1 Tax=Bradyrhizobium sacchari TaxID=1399419 RepID=A0A560IMZ8_9BRAD|nr:hypothetical protein FBZ94_104647 [Bradyrhizobium sacchari]TWB73768.1 hypothetical protein FBZ95_10518 [Bradyrhizobium sacchari]